jgi:hypothetical protein
MTENEVERRAQQEIRSFPNYSSASWVQEAREARKYGRKDNYAIFLKCAELRRKDEECEGRVRRVATVIAQAFSIYSFQDRDLFQNVCVTAAKSAISATDVEKIVADLADADALISEHRSRIDSNHPEMWPDNSVLRAACERHADRQEGRK